MKHKIEERITKITKTSVLIIGGVVSVYGYVLYFVNLYKNIWVRLGIVTIFFLSSCLVLYFGREKIFQKILQKFWKPDTKIQETLGKYYIYIFFEDHEKYDRSGTLNFTDSYAGLSISGDRLTDNEGKITAEKWFAQEAELYHFDNKIILVYQYWVQDELENKNQYSKLGIVTATSEDRGKSFRGPFKDIILESGKIDRSGTVTINKHDSV